MTEDTLAGGHIRVGEPADLEDDQQSSHWRKEDCQESEQKMDKSQNCQPKHPEPKKKVNLKQSDLDIFRFSILCMCIVNCGQLIGKQLGC